MASWQAAFKASNQNCFQCADVFAPVPDTVVPRMKKPQKRSGIFEKPVHGEKPKFQGSLTALKNGGKHSYEPNEVTIVHT